jgi:hypothetical protein
MNMDAAKNMVSFLDAGSEMFTHPNLLPNITVEGFSASYLLRAIATELGKKAEEAEKVEEVKS